MRSLISVGLTLSTLLVVTGVASPVDKTSTPEVRLTLQKGSKIDRVLADLRRTAAGVCVADASSLDPVVTRELQDLPLSRALDGISSDFDRYWLKQGQVLALQRRFSDPDEDAGLEIPEIRSLGADLYRLVRPFISRLPDEEFIRQQNDFADSITPEQMKAMANGGVPLTALPAAQRQAFLRVMVDHVYAPYALELERLGQSLAVWDRATLTDIFARGEKRGTLTVDFPDPAMSDGKGSCQLGVPTNGGRSVPRQADGREILDPEPPAPEDLRKAWDLDVQRVELGGLADRLQADGGPHLSVPAYARKRTLWVYSKGGSRAEVLSGLALLYGWKLTPARDGYALGRPQLKPARNLEELHAALLAAVPPALFHPTATYYRGATDRILRQMTLVFDNADRVAGKDWAKVEVAKLEPVNQQRLANCIAMTQLLLWYTNHGRLRAAPTWLVHPEQGVLTLTEPIRADNHPLLKFSVVREVAGPPHQKFEEGWGWYVNTSTLRKR